MKEYSYVIIAKKDQHEYSYPTLESVKKPVSKREATHMCPPTISHPNPPLPKKKQKRNVMYPVQMMMISMRMAVYKWVRHPRHHRCG
jgi:hypothetical protein